MVQVIGLMIAFYILTRIMEILTDGESHWLTVVFGAATILVVLFSLVILLFGAAS